MAQCAELVVRDSSVRAGLALSLGMTKGNLSLRLFDRVTRLRRVGGTAHLAFENRRRVRRDQFVIFQDELGINSIAGRFVNFVAAEGAVKFVFVIVICAEF